MTNDTIGCDISKDWIDAYRLSDASHQRFTNDLSGLAGLLNWAVQGAPGRVIYEPTGAYHRSFEEALSCHLPLCKVNPLHARRFAQASGVRTKTDKVDAFGNLVRFVLLPGNRYDTVGVAPLIEGLSLDALLAELPLMRHWFEQTPGVRHRFEHRWRRRRL